MGDFDGIESEEWFKKAVEKRVQEELKRKLCSAEDYENLKRLRHEESMKRVEIDNLKNSKINLMKKLKNLEKAEKQLKISEKLLPEEIEILLGGIEMSELKVLTEIEQVKEHIAITDEEIYHAKTQLKIKNKRLKDLENKCGLRVK